MPRNLIVQYSALAEIERVVSAWAGAWNSHDVEAAAVLVMPEVDFVNVLGRWLKGEDEFIEHHRRLHVGQMRNSTWSNLGYEVRFIGDDFAIVHLEWTIEGDEDPNGKPRRGRRGVFTWMLMPTGDRWLISVAHNTNLHRGVSHRLTPTTEDNCRP